MRFILLILIIVSIQSFGQVDSTVFKVNSIIIKGNENTKDFIIRRELTFSEGDLINIEDLYFNKERVFSLGLFNDVKLFQKSDTVFINVKESWYIYPIPFLDVKESDLDKITYGIAFLYKNFRGRNETIFIKAGLGYDPSIEVNYLNPLILAEYNMNFAIKFSYQNSGSKSLISEGIYGGEFDKKTYKFEVVLGKRLNLYNNLFFKAGYSYLEVDKFFPNRFTASDNRIDRAPVFGFEYIHDSRDLIQLPTRGFYLSSGIYSTGAGLNNIDYTKYFLDFRTYNKISDKVTLNFRLKGIHNAGKNIPYYADAFLGYDEYVRGFRNDVEQGNNSFVTKTEIRYSFFNDETISVDVPYIPQKLTSVRLGLYLYLFADAGTTFDNDENFLNQKYKRGYGIGLGLLFLPQNALQLEYAFNQYGQKEFKFATGFSF